MYYPHNPSIAEYVDGDDLETHLIKSAGLSRALWDLLSNPSFNGEDRRSIQGAAELADSCAEAVCAALAAFHKGVTANALTLDDAIGRHKAITDAINASTGPQPPQKLVDDAEAALIKLARFRCDTDAEFVKKLQYLSINDGDFNDKTYLDLAIRSHVGLPVDGLISE